MTRGQYRAGVAVIVALWLLTLLGLYALLLKA